MNKSPQASSQFLERMSSVRIPEIKATESARFLAFHDEVENVYQDVQRRISFYIEFLNYVTTIYNKRLTSSEIKRVNFQHEKDITDDNDLYEKLKLLKDVHSKLNEKMQTFELRSSQIGFDYPMNEPIVEGLKQKFESCKDLKDLTEREILQQIESHIDINKEEEAIDAFIKDRKNQKDSREEIFNIYKLKSKVMNDKIERLRSQFEKQSGAVDSVKQAFDDSINRLNNEIEQLKQVAYIDSQAMISPKTVIEDDTKFKQTKQKQEELEQKIDKLMNELQKLKMNREERDDTKILLELQKQQNDFLTLIQETQVKQQKIQEQNKQYREQIEQLKKEKQALIEREEKSSQLYQEQLKQKEDEIEKQKQQNEKLQSQMKEIGDKMSEIQEQKSKQEKSLKELNKENEELKAVKESEKQIEIEQVPFI